MYVSNEDILYKMDISTILSRLGLKIEDKNNVEVFILCPFHNDKTYGSFSINSQTGAWGCYSCGTKNKSLFTFIKMMLGNSDRAVYQFLDLNIDSAKQYFSDLIPIDEVAEVKSETVNITGDKFEYLVGNSEAIKDINLMYFKQRNMGQSALSYFEYRLMLRGFRRDYAMIPIYMNSEVVSVEYRKILLNVYLAQFFRKRIPQESSEQKLQYKNLKSQFEKLNLRLNKKDDRILYPNGFKKLSDYDEMLAKYILRPKVLYEKSSSIKNYIYNYDNLDFNQPIYIVEGLTSVPNVWLHLSKNATCTFGTQITSEQIDLLSKFPMILYLVENDEAGWLYGEKLMDTFGAGKVKCIPLTSDGGEATIEELRQEPIPSPIWQFRMMSKLVNE